VLIEMQKHVFGKRVGNAFPAFPVWPQERETARKHGHQSAKLVVPLDKTVFAILVFAFWGEVSCRGGAEPKNIELHEKFFGPFPAVPGSGSTSTSTRSQGFRMHI
jgi:hypothetical protein